MNHSIFAGFFCTLSLFFLCFEVVIRKENINKWFYLFYSLGCIFWLLLGAVTDQLSLYIISITQIIFLSFSYFLGSSNEAS